MPAAPLYRARRFDLNPIIRPHMDARMGANVQGPSLIRVNLSKHVVHHQVFKALTG